MSEVVRAALIGAGGFPGGHVVKMAPNLDNVSYVAVCDIDPDVARTAAEELGADRVTTDLGEVLADETVEMVDIQTPNFVHAEQAVAALAAGKHVLVQKPMATTIADAKRMIGAAREADRLLGVYMDDLNDPLLWDMRAAIRQGVIGRPVAFHLRYARPGGFQIGPDSWRRSATKTGGGSFVQLSIHNLRALLFALDERPVRVSAFQKTLLAPMEGDDSTAGAIELAGGLVGTAGSSYICGGTPEIPATLTEVFGTEGAIQQQRDRHMVRFFSRERTFGGDVIHYDTPGRTATYDLARAGHRRPLQHDAFARAIREGGTFDMSGEEGLVDLAVCRAMDESSRTGRAVDIEELIGEAG